MPETVGTVASLFLYPVKSMAGLAVSEAHAGLDGILGDRLYSYVRGDIAARSSFPWMTAREHARMLQYQPEFSELPSLSLREPAVTIRTPEGDVREPADPAISAELARHLGQPVFLLKSGRGIFDCQHVSLFSLATVRGLASEAACPIDQRQFRANVYFEPASGTPFEEEGWARCLFSIGDEVLLAIVQRDTRCMMINLNPDTGEQNSQVLKTVARRHNGQAGIYANVVRPGRMKVGDAIQLVSRL